MIFLIIGVSFIDALTAGYFVYKYISIQNLNKNLSIGSKCFKVYERL